MRRKRGGFIDSRLSVDTGGNWKAYTDTLPKGCAVIGTVTIGASDSGALVRLAGTKNFVKVNAGAVAMLNQRAVAVALQMAERQQFKPEMVSVEEWERSQPPRIEGEDKPEGHAGSVTQGGSVGGFQPAPRCH